MDPLKGLILPAGKGTRLGGGRAGPPPEPPPDLEIQ